MRLLIKKIQQRSLFRLTIAGVRQALGKDIMHHGIYTDFYCKALPMPDEGASDIAAAAEIMSAAYEYNLGRVVFAPSFHLGLPLHFRSMNAFLQLRGHRFRELRPKLPAWVNYCQATDLIWHPGCFDYPELYRFCVGSSDHILFTLPFPFFNDAVWFDINKLIHRTRYRPIFTNYDNCLITYSATDLESLERIPGAAFQFNVRSLSDKDVRRYVLKLLGASVRVVFGTGNHRSECPGIEMEKHLMPLRKNMGDDDFFDLMHSIKAFCRPVRYKPRSAARH